MVPQTLPFGQGQAKGSLASQASQRKAWILFSSMSLGVLSTPCDVGMGVGVGVGSGAGILAHQQELLWVSSRNGYNQLKGIY